MKNPGILLVGLSLLTLALVTMLSIVAEAIFVIGQVQIGHITPVFVYVVIALVFVIGIVSIFVEKK